MNASPTGAPLLLDPAAAGLFAADLSANPDAYLQQSQTLTNVAETLSNGLTHSTVNVDDLEAAQLAAVGLQAQARAAKAKAVAVELAANRAQRQAKKVFLRFAGQAKVSAREAWWIDEFASSQLGRELAALTGGPSFGMHLSSPASGEVTSPYGMRMHPVLHVRKLHSGTDFSGAGSPVQAAAGGTVIRADFDVAYGNYVVVWHGHFRGQSVATLYAHCRSLDVRIGDRVKRGDTLGAIGETGYTTGPHLHFEVRLAGRPIDPELYLR
ncbi:MAG: M23 family metallopeptidase [Actinomycetes bacterium]